MGMYATRCGQSIGTACANCRSKTDGKRGVLRPQRIDQRTPCSIKQDEIPCQHPGNGVYFKGTNSWTLLFSRSATNRSPALSRQSWVG
jgi:hypothetical protein